jgi:prepilin-type N-terminal cleavage/methylation domain-containing protein
MLRKRLRDGRFFSEGGFTLVELVITVAVLGILSTITAVGFTTMIGSSKDSEAITHLKAIVNAEAQSNVDSGQYSTLGALTTSYKLPVDASVNAAITLGTNNECFIATATSVTGNKYVATDVMTEPKNVNDVTPATLTTCSVIPVKATVTAPANDQPAPSITTLTMLSGKAQNLYTLTIQTDPTKDTSTSGTKLFSISNGALPAGLTIDPKTGIISGTPTVAGVFVLTARVDNANGFDTQAYSLQIDTQVTPFTNISAIRSLTTGTAYSGAREGTTVSFKGGACTTSSTMLAITYQATSPAGLAAVTGNYTWSPADTTNTVGVFELGGAQNGSSGNLTLSVKCSASQTPYQQSSAYTQTIPVTTATGTNSTAPEIHNISWTAVSSLPTTFTGTWSQAPTGNPAPSGTISATSALNTTVTYTVGSTYGYTTSYIITPNVSGLVATSSAAGVVSNVWPASPTASALTYTSTNTALVDGTLNWTNAGSCPAGTTKQVQHSQDYNSVVNTTNISTSVTNTPTWATPYTAATWAPSVAYQGYRYGVTVYTRCNSDSTTSNSTPSSYQNTWFTPMAGVATPVWASYSRYDTGSPKTVISTTWCVKVFSTTDCDSTVTYSMITTYTTTCSAGSSVSWSSYTGSGLSAASSPFSPTSSYYHDSNQGAGRGFGYLDQWDSTNSAGTKYANYSGATYRCATPWAAYDAAATTAQSPTAGDTMISVTKTR